MRVVFFLSALLSFAAMGADYNVVELPGTAGDYYGVYDNTGVSQEFEGSLAGWQEHGYGANSLEKNVSFVTVSGFEWAISSSSPAYNLLPSALVSDDIEFRARSGTTSAGAWELYSWPTTGDTPPARFWMGVP